MNKYIFKSIVFFLMLTICTFSLSGCYNAQVVDKLAYVVAIGLDIGKENNLRMSFQIATPDSSSEGGSSQSSNAVVNTIECASIDAGINLINSYISKEINLSHCKVIIFSEELAYKGISDYIYTLVNKIQIRPDTNIIVAKCDAEYFLNNSEPTLEKQVARYYETAPTSSEYTGFTDDIRLGEFFSDLKDTFTNPCAILGAVNTDKTHAQDSKVGNSQKDSTYTAGETPIQTKPNIENMGLAVFKGDVLVGELNGLETICHMIVTNKLRTCTITIPSPFAEVGTIDLNVDLKNKTKTKLEISNGTPYITCDISVNSRILSMNKESKYLNSENIKSIEEYANSYLKQHILDYLYKTSKDYESDIAGFGKYAVGKFTTWKDWVNYNWLENYKSAFFTVNVKSNVKSGHILLES